MKYLYIMLLLLLVSCRSSKQVINDTEYIDSTRTELIDSVHTSTNIGFNQDINDSIVTTITERITEVIRDRTIRLQRES